MIDLKNLCKKEFSQAERFLYGPGKLGLYNINTVVHSVLEIIVSRAILNLLFYHSKTTLYRRIFPLCKLPGENFLITTVEVKFPGEVSSAYHN
jgi:hypothetical protein